MSFELNYIFPNIEKENKMQERKQGKKSNISELFQIYLLFQ